MSVIDVDGGDSRNPDERFPDVIEGDPLPEKRPDNRTFSYDPSQVMDGSVNQMRFELGDTELEAHTGYASAVMSDEEYRAIIEGSSGWRQAKIRCIRYLLMLFLYQVDYSIDGLSEKMSDRYNRLKGMLDSLLKSDNLPKAGGLDRQGRGPHIFHYGMLENPWKWRR